MKSLAPFVVFVALAFAAASVGARFTPGEWYAALRKPALTPPGWVFPVVWTLLYVAMGVAAALAWRVRRSLSVVAPWILQLACNAAWSWLFFGLHRPDLALVDIVALWLAIVATIVVFRRHSASAAGLMVLYLVWVSFAAWLNAQIWRLNG